MMKIYIDSEYRCHLSDDGTMTAVETNFFDGKCDSFIEGYRYVPEGESWTREDGKVFTNQITPCKNSKILEAYQEQYESIQRELNEAFQEGVNSI